MHDSIRRHVTSTFCYVEYTGAWCELHTESCTCTTLHVELCRDLVICIALCIYTGLQTHNRIECVLTAGADKSTSICYIRYFKQRRLCCLRYLLICNSVS